MTDALETLVKDVRSCRLCERQLPCGPRPVVQIDASARVLIAGQAPGKRVHETGVPFDDPSGDRLRHWMGIDRAVFYDAKRVAILPMGFCYPGKGTSGDLPPIERCAATWRNRLLDHLTDLRLTLVIGQYAQRWHLADTGTNVTETVRNWQNLAPDLMPLPHPSPRNNIWLKKNSWFGEQVLPEVRTRVELALK